MNPEKKFESDGELLRQAMRRLVTGVTVVTIPLDNGMTGFTASSFTSVSLDPPLVLFCISNNSRSYKHIQNSHTFAIHILAHDQSEIAKGFASQSVDRSKICNWTLSKLGNPILDSYLTVLECSTHLIQEAGDHGIVVGCVNNIQLKRHESMPLIYHQGKMLAMPNELMPRDDILNSNTPTG